MLRAHLRGAAAVNTGRGNHLNKIFKAEKLEYVPGHEDGWTSLPQIRNMSGHKSTWVVLLSKCGAGGNWEKGWRSGYVIGSCRAFVRCQAVGCTCVMRSPWKASAGDSLVLRWVCWLECGGTGRFYGERLRAQDGHWASIAIVRLKDASSLNKSDGEADDDTGWRSI